MPPLPSFLDHPLEKLEEALALRKQIAALQEKLSNLFNSDEDVGVASPALKADAGTNKSIGPVVANKSLKGRTLSPEVRARMAAAQKARHAKARSEMPASVGKSAPATSKSKEAGSGTAGGGSTAAATPPSRKKGAPAPNAKAAGGSAKK